MLIGNYSVYNKSCGSFFGNASQTTSVGIFGKTNSNRNKFLSFDQKNSVPWGYGINYSWTLAQKSGGMASDSFIDGLTTTNITLYGGYGLSSSIYGSSQITQAILNLIVSALATLSGFSSLSSDIVGKLEAASTIAASGNLTSSIQALANVVADITSGSNTNFNVSAIASISANVTPFTELSPASLAAAVWNALASEFTENGTMGYQLNKIEQLESLLRQIKAIQMSQL